MSLGQMVTDLFHTANWGDVPTWIGATLTAGTVALASRQVKQTSKQNQLTSKQEEDSLRPVVVATIAEGEAGWTVLDFVLTNVGASPAYDISLAMIDAPELSPEIKEMAFWESSLFKNNLPILGPGQEIRILADTSARREESGPLKDTGKIQVSYSSINGTRFGDELSLDMGFLRGALRMDVYSLHDVGATLKSIDQTLKKFGK